MKHRFLFRSSPPRDGSVGRRGAFWLWNFGLLLLGSLGVGAVCLFLSVGPYELELLEIPLGSPLLLVLNLLPPVGLAALLYGLTGRVWAAYWGTALPCVGLAVGNYYKLLFRDDPLLLGDLLLLREAGTMAGNYDLTPGRRLLLALAAVLLAGVLLTLFVRGRAGCRCRFALLSGSLLLWVCLSPTYLDDALYEGKAAHYDKLENRWSATAQYVAHGFLYPFLHSAGDAVVLPPEGYEEREAALLLSARPDAGIPQEKKVHVVAVMLEAYADFTELGTPKLAQDVYKVWHDLREEGYSGRLVTNIFAGGTVDTERSFLTGYPTLGSFRTATNAFPWYFRSQGYTVEGMHPCFQWFYNRKNVNEALGFQDYRFVENHFGAMTDGKVAMDGIFFPALLEQYRKGTAGEAPYFNFSVSYQGHGPYDSDICWWGDRGDFVVDDGTYTTEEQYILDNYFGSIADTNEQIKQFTDALRTDEEPVVLVLFGDHMPWMGDNNSVYDAMGIAFDLDREEGFRAYYSTPYLIWANDAAKQTLGRDFTGKGPDISPCFLMQQVFDLCGWEGPALIQAARQVSPRVPVIHTTGRYRENDTFTQTLSPEGEALVRDYTWQAHHQQTHFSYGELTGKD